MSALHQSRRTRPLPAVACLIAVLLAGAFLGLSGPADPTQGAAAPPQVTSVFPADGAEGVPIRQVFTVSFDQDMDATTIDTGSYYMFKTGGIAVPATIRYDAATRTATLTPVAELKAGSTYYVILTGAVKSAAGLSVVGATLTWRFRTAQALPPHIVTKTPPEGATACPLTQVVSVVFDTSMDATTFTSSSFYFAKRGGLPLPAVLAYDDATMTATFTPTALLDEATTYDVTITSVVRGMTGMFVIGTPFTWSFTTVLVQPPAVLSRTPTVGAAEVPLDVMVTITFDRDMDRDTVTPDSFFIQKVGADSSMSEPLEVVLTCNDGVITLTPAMELDPDSTYKVTLTEAVKNIKGASVVGAPITWTFKTKKVPLPFLDVPVSHPYFPAIFQLAKRHVISGFSDDTFRPTSLVTRQQFAKMIIRALGLEVSKDGVSPFTDIVHSTPEHPVDPQDLLYPDHYIATAFAHGIIAGKTATTFEPYDSITRFQAITMVVRSLDDIDRGLLENPPAGYQSTWNPALSPEHGQNARLAESNGLLEDLPLASLDPLAPMTRGEIAQLEWNLITFLE